MPLSDCLDVYQIWCIQDPGYEKVVREADLEEGSRRCISAVAAKSSPYFSSSSPRGSQGCHLLGKQQMTCLQTGLLGVSQRDAAINPEWTYAVGRTVSM